MLDTKICSMCEKLDVINGRMKSLETRQESLEKEVKKGCVSVQSSPALTPSGSKRQTPVALQVIELFIQKGGTLRGHLQMILVRLTS